MSETVSAELSAAGRAALDALQAENRASAARLRACYALHQLCEDEQFERDVEAGHLDPENYLDTPGDGGPFGRNRPDHAVLDPFTVACAELVAHFGVHQRRASAMLTLAVNLVENFPALLSAMESGRLDERTAGMLASHMRTVDSTVRRAVQQAVVDWLLAALAAGERPGRNAILSRTDQIIAAHDPIGIRARRAAAARERNVSIRRKPDGMADLTAHLTAVEASTISAALDSAASAEVAREKAARKSAAADIAAAAGMAAAAGNSDTAGDPGTGAASHDAIPLLGERSNGERRADALIGALLGTGTDDEVGRAAGHAGPGAGVRAGAAARHGAGAIAPLIRPVITVLAPRGPDDEPEVYFPRSGPAAIDALIALLSRSVGANITLPDSTPGSSDTAGGRRRYRISAELARRVRLRDGTCRHPGCSEPAENCDVDHVRPFSHSDPPRGGPTSEANLMCLCRRHHRLKTFHDWRYRLSRDGTLSVSTSSGLTLTTRPDGPLARWRELDDESVPRSASTHRPESTHWYRRARRVAAERQQTLDAAQSTPANRPDRPERPERPDRADPDLDPPPF